VAGGVDTGQWFNVPSLACSANAAAITLVSNRSKPSQEVSRGDRCRSCKDQRDIAFRASSFCAHIASNRFRHFLIFSAARRQGSDRRHQVFRARCGENSQT